MDLSLANRDVFTSDAVCHLYENLSGWLDPGERASILAAARTTRNTPILDVGAGAGRTASLLQLIGNDYTAVDYSPPMVEAFRRNHPGVPVQLGDARDLSAFADSSFGLIMFSNNGIDAVDRQGREQVLAEFARLVRPDGRIVFSTLNKHGRSYNETPWQLHRPGEPWRLSPRGAVRAIGKLVLQPHRQLRGVRNYWRWQRVAVDHGSWALGALRVHEFGPFVYFTTMAGMRADVAAAGLEIVDIFAAEGHAIDSAQQDSHTDYFNVVARKRE